MFAVYVIYKNNEIDRLDRELDEKKQSNDICLKKLENKIYDNDENENDMKMNNKLKLIYEKINKLRNENYNKENMNDINNVNETNDVNRLNRINGMNGYNGMNGHNGNNGNNGLNGLNRLNINNVTIEEPRPRMMIDPVKIYDSENLADPLTGPTSRPPSYLFGPTLLNPLFNTPSRGLPDNFSYVGNLIELKEEKEDNKEKEVNLALGILQLMGRQKYPNSYKYDYYVLISRGGNDYIKMDIKTRNEEELYDGDEVFIPELHKKYRFKKNKSFWKQYYN